MSLPAKGSTDGTPIPHHTPTHPSGETDCPYSCFVRRVRYSITAQRAGPGPAAQQRLHVVDEVVDSHRTLAPQPSRVIYFRGERGRAEPSHLSVTSHMRPTCDWMSGTSFKRLPPVVPNSLSRSLRRCLHKRRGKQMPAQDQPRTPTGTARMVRRDQLAWRRCPPA